MSATLRDVLATKGTRVFGLPPDESVASAVSLMNREEIGSLLIGRSPVDVGLLTERDILVRVVERNLDPRQTRIVDVMKKDPLCGTPDWTVLQSMERMTVHRQRHLPIFDGAVLVGLVSLGDLVHHVTHDLENLVDDLSRFIHGPHSMVDASPAHRQERRDDLKARPA